MTLETLRIERRRLNISQKAMAEALHVDATHLCRVESGERQASTELVTLYESTLLELAKDPKARGRRPRLHEGGRVAATQLAPSTHLALSTAVEGASVGDVLRALGEVFAGSEATLPYLNDRVSAQLRGILCQFT